MSSTADSLIQRIHRELLDHSDEELELELAEDGYDLNALFDEQTLGAVKRTPDTSTSPSFFACWVNW